MQNPQEIKNLKKQLLKSWQKYCNNKHSFHPCENFKAGFLSNYLLNKNLPIESLKDYLHNLTSYK